LPPTAAPAAPGCASQKKDEQARSEKFAVRKQVDGVEAEQRRAKNQIGAGACGF
jgi:hypothetical protein